MAYRVTWTDFLGVIGSVELRTDYELNAVVKVLWDAGARDIYVIDLKTGEVL